MSTSPKPTRIAFNAELRYNTGWGICALYPCLHLIQDHNIQPIIIKDPKQHDVPSRLMATMQPAVDAGAQLIETAKAFPGAGIELDCPIIEPAGIDEFVVPKACRWTGRPSILRLVFEQFINSETFKKNITPFNQILTISDWAKGQLQSIADKPIIRIHEGVEPELITYSDRPSMLKDRFVIFSGGKLEYRKGQDLVLAATKIFMNHHPDAILMTAWHNPWPKSVFGMSANGHINTEPPVDPDGTINIAKWAFENGLTESQWFELPPNRPEGDPSYSWADVGLFPNRCEGGTNLVALETMARGIPCIIANNTGQAELPADDSLWLTQQSPVNPVGAWKYTDTWGESSIDEIVEKLEHAYQNHEALKTNAKKIQNQIHQYWTWARYTDDLVQNLQTITPKGN